MERITIFAIFFLAILAGPTWASRFIVKELKVVDKNAPRIKKDIVIAAVEQPLNGPCAPIGTSCHYRSCCSSADYNGICSWPDEICYADVWPSPYPDDPVYPDYPYLNH